MPSGQALALPSLCHAPVPCLLEQPAHPGGETTTGRCVNQARTANNAQNCLLATNSRSDLNTCSAHPQLLQPLPQARVLPGCPGCRCCCLRRVCLCRPPLSRRDRHHLSIRQHAHATFMQGWVAGLARNATPWPHGLPHICSMQLPNTHGNPTGGPAPKRAASWEPHVTARSVAAARPPSSEPA